MRWPLLDAAGLAWNEQREGLRLVEENGLDGESLIAEGRERDRLVHAFEREDEAENERFNQQLKNHHALQKRT